LSKSLAISILALSLIRAAVAPAFPAAGKAAGKGYVISARNAVSVATEETLRESVEFLTDPIAGGRATGSMGSTMAGWWIARRMEHAGLVPAGDSFYHGFKASNGAKGMNIMGILPGKGSSGKQYIIVAAHYDHLGELGGTLYPGADSNASGVAAMLTVADMFRKMNSLGREYHKSILFVALDAKTLNLGGAVRLLNELRSGTVTDPSTGKAITPDDIEMMVNLDQVGSTLSPLHPGNKDYIMMLSEGPGGRRDNLLAVNRKERLGMDISFSYYGSRDFTNLFYRRVSDQKPFLEAGITSVMFTSGITMLNNKPGDSVETLDFPVFRKRVILIFHWLSGIL